MNQSFFFVRFAVKFSAAFDVMLFGYFLWSILTICDTLLMVHIEIVSYFLILFCLDLHLVAALKWIWFSGSWCHQFTVDVSSTYFGILVFCTNFSLLWSKPNCKQLFRWRWLLQSMRLVSIFTSRSTSNTNDYCEHNTTLSCH